MSEYEQYDGKIVRITDRSGRVFTGKADTMSAEYCFHEFGREEAGIRVCRILIYESDIREIRDLPEI